MIDWKRQFPTFSSWGAAIGKSASIKVACDSWMGVERRSIAEVGRGLCKLSLWELGGSHSRRLDSIMLRAVTQDQLTDSLGELLQRIRARGCRCDLLLHAPWAVAKVFELTTDEAHSPTQWIARHRSEIFPEGIEEDLSLTYSVRHVMDNQSTLIVGLARHSTVQLLRSVIEKAGYSHLSTIIGPLSSLERTTFPADRLKTLTLESGGGESVGCWIIDEIGLMHWTEVTIGIGEPIDEVLGRLMNNRDSENFSDEPRQPIETPAYEPPVNDGTRWRIPNRRHNARVSIAVLNSNSLARNSALQLWLNWVFRWSIVTAVLSLVLAISALVVAESTSVHSGPALDRLVALNERRQILSIDLRKLKQSESTSWGETSDIGAGRLWFDLGIRRPPGLWLRQIRTVFDTKAGRSPTWIVEGLANDKDAPNKYAEGLRTLAGYRTSLTRLERTEKAKLKDLQSALHDEVYRFAIEIKH